jgi:DNA-binding PadR family transcriptional regulator
MLVNQLRILRGWPSAKHASISRLHPLNPERMLWLRKRIWRKRPRRTNNVQAKQDSLHTRTLGLVQVAIMNVITSKPDRAYGTAITDEVSRVVGRELADAQVYIALGRLEEHGLISSRVDEIPMPSKKSRGRPRKYYASTAKGRRALESAGAYTLSRSPFMQSLSTPGGDHEGTQMGPMPPPVVV